MTANRFLIRWVNGWAEREDAASIAADGQFEELLGLGALGSLDEAYRVADGQLAEFARRRIETTIGIAPESDASEPFVAYRVGDTVAVQSVPHRVLGFTVTEDPDSGQGIVVPTLNDDIVLTHDQRVKQAINKMLLGTIGGRSKVAQPVVPTFVPRGLIVTEEPLPIAGWWDASNAASIHATGSSVDRVDDLSGNGRHFTATGSARPQTGNYTQNGLNVFDTVPGQCFTQNLAPFPQPYSLYCVFNVVASSHAGGNCVIFHDATNAPTLTRDGFFSPAHQLFWCAGDCIHTDGFAGEVVNLSTWYLARAFASGNNGHVQFGTSAVTTGFVNSEGWGTTSWGDCTSGTMRFSEAMLLDDDVFGTAQDDQLTAYFTGKWAL